MPFKPGDFVLDAVGNFPGSRWQLLRACTGPDEWEYDWWTKGAWYYAAGPVPRSRFPDVGANSVRMCTAAEMPPTCSPHWTAMRGAALTVPQPAPVPAPAVQWKVGDFFCDPRYPRDIYQIVGPRRADGFWPIDEWGGTQWYKTGSNRWDFGRPPPVVPCAGPGSDSPLLVKPPTVVVIPAPTTGYKFVGRKKPEPQQDSNAVALLKFFAGDVGKKPDWMPAQCGQCGTQMSATLDAYNGPRDDLTVLKVGPVWQLCSRCRSRGY